MKFFDLVEVYDLYIDIWKIILSMGVVRLSC